MNLRIPSLLTTGLLVFASLAAGQHWEFEQVDTEGWGDRVRVLHHPDGCLYLCYSHDSTRSIRLAWLDSTWHYEDVPAQRRPDVSSVDFNIGPSGEIGVLYSSVGRIRVMQRMDSTWVEDSAPAEPWYGDVRVAFDTLGSMLVGAHFQHSSGRGLRVLRRGTFWTAETVSTYGLRSFYGCAALNTARDGRVWTMYYFSWEMFGGDAWGCVLQTAVREDTGWVVDGVTSVMYGGFSAYAGEVDRAGVLRSCVWEWTSVWPADSGFYYCGERIDQERTTRAALAFDLLGRPVITRSLDSSLVLAFRDGGRWITRQILSRPIDSQDLVFDVEGQPVVAYKAASGLWLARGIDVLGAREQELVDVRRSPGPTVMRSAELARAEGRVLDAMGRDVTERTGALSPGVYFLVPASGVERQASSVRKVIITR